MSATQAVRLADGRALAFAQWGPPDGSPVLECHGNPGSRTLLWDETALRRAGVRLITADRPGIGGSSPSPGRAVIDWAADVAELLDALEIERLPVLGYSVGGAYASACAGELPDRVTALALVSSVVPLDEPGAFRELGRRPEWILARRAPRLARAAIAAQRSLLRHQPDLIRAGFVATLSPPDRAVVRSDPGLAKRGIEMGIEATRQGGTGLVEDLRAVMRPWGFRLEEIGAPTAVWQGDRDGSIPFHWGARLAGSIPGASLRPCAGDGHLLIASRIDQILADLVERPAPATH